MFKKILSTAAVIAISATSAAYAETVSVHGSTTVYANIFQPHKTAIEKNSGVTLKVVANGSGRGLSDLSAGKSDMAMISSDLEATIAKANKKKPGSVATSGLIAHPVGETRVAFIVHPSNGVKKLTLAQVKDILSGAIKNWKEIGGNDAAIVTVLETAGGGIRSMVEKEVLKGAAIAGAKRELPNATLITKIVSQLPNAFGVASIATVTSAVAEVTTDSKISQPLILVTKGDPSPTAKKVIMAAKSAK